MSPMDSAYYCHMHGDLEYPVEFSELMFKATTETLCGLMSYSRLESMVDKGFANLAKDIDSARKYCNAVTPRLIDHFEDCAEYLKENRRPNCLAIASRIIRLRPVGLDVLSKTKPL